MPEKITSELYINIHACKIERMMPDPDLGFKGAVINKIIAFKHLVFIIGHSPKDLRVVVIGGELRQRIEAPEELFQSVYVLTVVLLQWECGLDPWGGLRLSWKFLCSFQGRDPALQSPATWSSCFRNARCKTKATTGKKPIPVQGKCMDIGNAIDKGYILGSTP